MALKNSFATFYGAIYPAVGNVINTAPVYGDAINALQGAKILLVEDNEIIRNQWNRVYWNSDPERDTNAPSRRRMPSKNTGCTQWRPGR